MVTNWVPSSTTGQQMADGFNELILRNNRNSDSGVVTGVDVVKVTDTEFQITTGTFQEVDKNTGALISTNVTTPINVTTVNNGAGNDGFPNSGSWYVTIKPYDGMWVDITRKKDIGTELTVEWFPQRPLGRGPAEGGVTLKKVFFVNATILLTETARPYSFDGIDHVYEQVMGSGGRFCTLSNDRVTDEIDISEFISLRANAFGPGVHGGFSKQTNNIYDGVLRDDGVTRGVPIRGHLFNLLDASGGSNEYIPNVDVTPGGTYYPWWDYLDQTRGQTPSAALTPTAAGSNRWVLHWITMFAGKDDSQNPIIIWAEEDHSSPAEALAQPIPTFNSRTVDVTVLGGLLINTNDATLANAQWIQAPRFANVM